ncbi:MAG: serine hydrolase [Bacillota bacterium]
MTLDMFWNELKTDLAAVLGQYRGVAGLHLVEVSSGHRIDFNGDAVLAAGSTIKVPVLMELFRKAARGEIDLNEAHTLDAEDAVGGSGVLQNLEGEVTLSLRNLAILMINASDNIATNICIERAGIDDVNRLIRDIGCTDTVVQRMMMDSQAAAEGRENLSTARDMVRWIETLHGCEWENPELCEEITAVLGKPKMSPIRAAVPADVPLVGKTGGLEGVRCEVALVEQRRRPYILGIMTAFGIDDDNSETITELAQTAHAYLGALERFTEYGRGLQR